MRLLLVVLTLLGSAVELVDAQSSGSSGREWSVACDFVYQVACASFAASPLCASDGNTYDNECFFAQSHCVFPSVNKVHDGACGNPVPSTTASGTTTVSGTTVSRTTVSGSTVSGTIVPGTSVSGQKVTFDFFCKSLQHVACGPDHEAICGSDGFTYHGICRFERARCRHAGLHVVRHGYCSS